MALNIRNEEVNRLATALAERRGITKTEAVLRALADALEREDAALSLRQRLEPVIAGIAGYRRSGTAADKAFFDDINGEY